MGFDVVYLPPIHPIGRTARKGPDNALTAGPGDPGSPWAIGGLDGGHTAIHAELGTLDDFRALLAAAKSLGLEVALDLAIQCSPDHPWVREHPEWFYRRPDGTIKYAENPPKKYQDIYPAQLLLPGLGVALGCAPGASCCFWVGEGVRTFRVDNPHTKPLGLLGVAHRPGADVPSRGGLSRGGVHAPEGDAGARRRSGSASHIRTLPGVTSRKRSPPISKS